jgi:acylphosphatase
MQSAVRITVKGEVQGVFFRDFVKQAADFLRLTGWVKNSEDGTVEIMAEGEKTHLEQLIARCRKGPPAARVAGVDLEWTTPGGDYKTFSIR